LSVFNTLAKDYRSSEPGNLALDFLLDSQDKESPPFQASFSLSISILAILAKWSANFPSLFSVWNVWVRRFLALQGLTRVW
jgi:hypothetical protein